MVGAFVVLHQVVVGFGLLSELVIVEAKAVFEGENTVERLRAMAAGEEVDDLWPQFAELGKEMADSHPLMSELFIWFSIPFYVVVAWVFHTMERIGRTGENPFEGTANDVPISTIARGIEIDLRQNLGEAEEAIPAQFPTRFDTQF